MYTITAHYDNKCIMKEIFERSLQKYSKNSNAVKYYYNLKYVFLWCKAEFSSSLLQCHMILQK